VLAAVRNAGDKTGADPAVLMAVAYKESNFNEREKSHLSSAKGLFQFTAETWVETVKEFGERHGLGHHITSSIVQRDDGGFAVSHGLKSHILKLRDDPTLSAVMAAERSQATKRKFEALLGREPKPVDLYMAHLLGDTAGARFLREVAAHPGRRADAVVGHGVAKKNAPIFFDDHGRPRTVAEVYAAQDAEISGLVAQYAAFLSEQAREHHGLKGTWHHT
jgi:hypothetical protein